MQKGSFWTAKGALLQCKRSPFGMQKDSFLRWHAALLMYRLKICVMYLQRIYTSTEA